MLESESAETFCCPFSDLGSGFWVGGCGISTAGLSVVVSSAISSSWATSGILSNCGTVSTLRISSLLPCTSFIE